MPGLIRGVARTAAIAGTATAVSNRVSRRQGQKWAAEAQQQQPQQYAAPAPAPQEQQYAPPPPAPEPVAAAPAPDRMAQLRELGELKAQGILTEAEFEAEKAKILAS